MDERFQNRSIRRQILHVLHDMAAGAWLNLPTLREILAIRGDSLTLLDVRRHCYYLADKEIACVELEEIEEGGQNMYRYRVTARGTRVVEGEEKVPGIG